MTHTKRVRRAYKLDRSVSRADYHWMIVEARKWDREDRLHTERI